MERTLLFLCVSVVTPLIAFGEKCPIGVQPGERYSDPRQGICGGCICDENGDNGGCYLCPLAALALPNCYSEKGDIHLDYPYCCHKHRCKGMPGFNQTAYEAFLLG